MKRDKKVKRVLAKLSRFTEEELSIPSDIISGCPALNLLKTGSLYHPWPTQCSFTRILIDTLKEMPEITQIGES